MAFDYKLVDKKNEYVVFETTTNQVIKKFARSKFLEAKKFTRSLNLGSGFSGFTPSFFLVDVKKYITET
jgi:hypothetical protein